MLEALPWLVPKLCGSSGSERGSRGQEGSGGCRVQSLHTAVRVRLFSLRVSLPLPMGHSGLSPGRSLPSGGSSFPLLFLHRLLHGFYRLCQAGPLGTVSVRLIPSWVFTPMQPFRLLILLGFQFSGGSRVLDTRVLEQQSDGLTSSKTETTTSRA